MHISTATICTILRTVTLEKRKCVNTTIKTVYAYYYHFFIQVVNVKEHRIIRIRQGNYLLLVAILGIDREDKDMRAVLRNLI